MFVVAGCVTRPRPKKGKASWGFGNHILGPRGRPQAPELILWQVIMVRDFTKWNYTP